MVNFSTGLNNLKAKGDDLDIGKLKTILVHLIKLDDVVHKQVVKKKKNAKVNNLEKNFWC